jgi:hypothetical protein
MLSLAMRRVLLVLIGLAALVLAGQRLRVWLASDATRIRWRLEEMEEGFNETRLAPCMRGVAAEWRDTESRVDRALLADLLRSLFFHEKDPESGRFPYRVELERETLAIEPDPQADGRARVEVVVRFSALERGAWSETWRVRVRAELAEDPDLGWQVLRSEHETLSTDGRLVDGRRAGR